MPLSIPGFMLTLCRVIIGLLFLYSFLGKITDISSFQKAIRNFQIVPPVLIKPFSYLLVFAEITIVGLMALGREFLLPGFGLAAFLLLIFAIAIGSVLRRRISTSCNCFGPSEKTLTFFDIIRNAIFILIAFSGVRILIVQGLSYFAINITDVVLAGIMAVCVILILTHLSEIFRVFLPGAE